LKAICSVHELSFEIELEFLTEQTNHNGGHLVFMAYEFKSRIKTEFKQNNNKKMKTLMPKSYFNGKNKAERKGMYVECITHRFMDEHQRITTLPLRIRIRKNLAYIRKT
jgi:hypothetical protein